MLTTSFICLADAIKTFLVAREGDKDNGTFLKEKKNNNKQHKRRLVFPKHIV